MKIDDVVMPDEAPALLGLKSARFLQLMRTDPDFPPPVAKAGNGYLHSRSALIAYRKQREKRMGKTVAQRGRARWQDIVDRVKILEPYPNQGRG